jgi:predicted MFS family arabinose efflux permease
MVAAMAPPSRLAHAIGLTGAAGLVMNAAAPAIAEPLAEAVGYRPVFLLVVAAGLAGAALARRLPDDPPGAAAAAGPAPPGSAAPSGGRGGQVPAALLGAFGVAGLSFSVMFTFLTPFALERDVTVMRPFFVAYTVAALAVRLLGARIADRFGHRTVTAVALVWYGAVVALVGVAGPTHLVVIGVAFGLAHGAVFPAAMAMLLDGSVPAHRARQLALANGSMNLGYVAVLLVGIVAEHAGYPVVFVAAGLATLGVAALLVRRRQGADAAVPVPRTTNP